MRYDNEGNMRTLEEDINWIWKLHGLKVIKEEVSRDKWIITAKRIK